MPERHPGTQHLLGLFEYAHLPPHLQEISIPLRATALDMTEVLQDGPELTTGLRKLLEAKDCFVRQAVIDHRATAARRPPRHQSQSCWNFQPVNPLLEPVEPERICRNCSRPYREHV